MRGTEIIVTSEPQGRFGEGQITDTSKPGMMVEIVPNSTFIGGHPKYRARSSADGTIGPILVLLADRFQGKLSTDAYSATTQCFVYAPVAEEELNVLLGDVAGTGDIVTQGDLFGVSSAGKLKANSAYASAPFQAMETLAALTADTLLWCKYLGNQA